MKTIGLHTRSVALATALLLVLQIPPAFGDTPGGTSPQGARFPGLPLPSVEPIEVTFTKWPVPGSTTPYPCWPGSPAEPLSARMLARFFIG